ncbi:helix-turn-helix domain-containing protein [Candidatus Woesearchaeota archaeon]|nr:helix-turn-helix domain-containing protein [Candidatus Woesearchaeota archaeon]
MWVMKLKVESKNQFLGRLAIKHKVSMTGYPLSYYKDEKWIYLITCGFMFGEEKNKKRLVKDAKKQPELVKLEMRDDFAVLVTKQPLFTEPVWNPKIIRPSPTIINCKEKMHTWELASFDRKILGDVLKFAEKHLGARLLKLRNENISNISITRLLPELSAKQKIAMEIAINNGYYSYPKKINMEKLAKIMGVSYSTYQQHLKTAESKIIPSIYEEL